MRKWYLFLFISIVVIHCGFSQDIKLPDEKIIGEDLLIKKSSIFIRPAPDFEVSFPEITISVEQLQGKIPSSAEMQQKKPPEEGYFYISAGSYELIQSSFFYHRTTEQNTNYSVLFENSFTGGYRTNGDEQKTGLVFHREKPSSDKFSMDFKSVGLGLPGKDSNPLDLNRDSFSIKNTFSYLKESVFTPSLSHSFYSIDDTSANFLVINLFFNNLPFTFETELEKQDVFNETSTSSFSQAVLVEKGNLKLGGEAKIIEGYGVRILPEMNYRINDNASFGISSFYKIPNLFEDIMFTNYKELVRYNLAPEEEYKLNISFTRELENTKFDFDIVQTYRDSFYTWVDSDDNGFLEPYQEQCWETSLGMHFKQNFSDNLSIFLKGEKIFKDRKIDFYPEEVFTSGIILSYDSLSFKLWSSYIGERTFSKIRTGSDTIFNAELKMSYGKIEWGISIENLLDREYSIIPGYPAENRKVVSYLKMLF